MTSQVGRPRRSLARVLEDLGSTLLDLVYGEEESHREVVEVVVHDPYDVEEWPPGSLVLGVGARTPKEIMGVLECAVSRRASGAIFRSPIPDDPELTSALLRGCVPIIALSPGASWVQTIAILRSLLNGGVVDVATLLDPSAGLTTGDLFAQANAIAALLDAPIVIEDRNSRVLAFSGRQDEADQNRVDTILGRQVPTITTKYYEERGVFRELYRSEQPLYIIPPEGGEGGLTMPRMAIAVRAGDEVLGSIWAVAREPLSPQRSQALVEAAKIVALHLISQRGGADVRRRLVADLVATALEGAAGSVDAAERLGLAGQAAVVLALVGSAEDAHGSFADRFAARERLADAFALHLVASRQGSVAALVGDTVYGIVPVGGRARDPQRDAAQLASDFLRRTSIRGSVLVGVGHVAESPSQLVRSCEGAVRAARVLRSGRGGAQRVVCIEDVLVHAQLLEMASTARARGDAVTGPLARLLEHDQLHQSDLVDSLESWLNHFGDAVAAARAVHVHPNTLRYRLRRAAAVADLDMSDYDSLFAIMLQLRLRLEDR